MESRDLIRVTLVVLASSALLASLAAPAQAEDNIGRIGIGYTISNAPLGVRYWFDKQLGVDGGVGLVINGHEPDVETDDPDDETDTADWAIDAGFLYAFTRSKNSVFFGRLSLNLDRRYAVGVQNDGDQVHDSRWTTTVAAWGGIELFMTELGFPELSLQGAVGLAYVNSTGPQNRDDQNDDWTFGSLTTGLSLTSAAEIGFHYYF